MIDVSGLTKTYPGVLAVDDLTFKVDKGEIISALEAIIKELRASR